MKKPVMLLLAALCLGLTGCAPNQPPERAADGSSWDEGWVTVGGVIGVDAPSGMDPRENNEALAANGMYYATWSMGESEPYINGDGEEAELYDAQVYLLLGKYRSAKDAENTLAQWKDMASLNYVIESTVEETHNGVDFTVITYTFESEENPYARGASAFGVYRNCAVSVELTCQENFGGDASQLLARFLDHCHYAAP